jgi:hypothetical protein
VTAAAPHFKLTGKKLTGKDGQGAADFHNHYENA